MILIKLGGGLGNQMFQYALYKTFIINGMEAKLDNSKYHHIDEKRKCILDYPCFNLKYELCTEKEAKKYVLGTSMLARIMVKFIGDKKTHIYEKADYEYDPSIIKCTEGYLDGFWQTWKYMDGVQNEIINCFQFVEDRPQIAMEYLQKIKETDSVAVHVRRGDYLKLQKLYGNICTENYYRNAICKMESMLRKPVFYFFSDDMDWTKKTFKDIKNSIFVDGRGDWQDYIDLQLMTECKNMIMANSSFSWWAAFLNKNASKNVICPSKWINTKETPDVYCPEWIKI